MISYPEIPFWDAPTCLNVTSHGHLKVSSEVKKFKTRTSSLGGALGQFFFKSMEYDTRTLFERPNQTRIECGNSDAQKQHEIESGISGIQNDDSPVVVFQVITLSFVWKIHQ